MGNLFQELKRSKVFRVAAVYAIVAWLIIQVALCKRNQQYNTNQTCLRIS